MVVHALDEGPPNWRREPLRGAELLNVPSAFESTVFTCHAVGRIRCVDTI